MKWPKRLVASLIAGAAVVATVSCSDPTKDDAGSAAKSTLNIFLYQKPKSFSQFAPASGPDTQVMSLVLERLMGVDQNGQLVPELAESYEVSPDATTYTFKLRKGLKWSDGKPLTSADVLWSYNAYANPKTKSPAAGTFTGIEGVKALADGTAQTASGFSAPDESTFVFKTTKPDFGILEQGATKRIMPKHILGDVPPEQLDGHAFWQKPNVGNGPYTFVEYKTDQYVHLKRNPNYREKVSVENVYLKPVTSDVATAQLSSGEMDIVSVSPTDLKTIESISGVTVSEVPTGGFVRAMVNHTQPRFKDPRVSQAFLYAVDREAIVRTALAGKGAVQNSSFGKKFTTPNLSPYAYDPKKAKALLTEAGWDFSKPVELIWIKGGNPDRDAAATVMEAQLNEIGVKLKLRNVQGAELGDSYRDKKFDMVLFGGGRYETDGYSSYTIVACDKQFPTGGNVTYFCNPDMDKLMNEANATADEAKRIELYQKASAIDNAQVPYLWLYQPKGLWAVGKRVSGFVGLDPGGAGFFEPHKWTVNG